MDRFFIHRPWIFFRTPASNLDVLLVNWLGVFEPGYALCHVKGITVVLYATLRKKLLFASGSNFTYPSILLKHLRLVDSLRCIFTVFIMLSGEGEALNIDPSRFYWSMYRLLPSLVFEKHSGWVFYFKNFLISYLSHEFWSGWHWQQLGRCWDTVKMFYILAFRLKSYCITFFPSKLEWCKTLFRTTGENQEITQLWQVACVEWLGIIARGARHHLDNIILGLHGVLIVVVSFMTLGFWWFRMLRVTSISDDIFSAVFIHLFFARIA